MNELRSGVPNLLANSVARICGSRQVSDQRCLIGQVQIIEARY